MTLNSSRLVIAQGIVLMLQGVMNGSNPLYGPGASAVKLGAMFDPTPFTTGWAEVTFHQARSGPVGSGGNMVGWRIEDNPIFRITSGWRYDTDSTAATTSMLTAMDILMPILHSHYQIPAPGNPTQPIASIYSLLEDQPERAMPVKFPNGDVYLLWETYCTAKQQYNVTIVNP